MLIIETIAVVLIIYMIFLFFKIRKYYKIYFNKDLISNNYHSSYKFLLMRIEELNTQNDELRTKIGKLNNESEGFNKILVYTWIGLMMEFKNAILNVVRIFIGLKFTKMRNRINL